MATIRGTNGDDALSGTAGADDILGLAGADRLSGLGGNDTLLGGRGDDRLDGGAGSDTASVRDAPGFWYVDLDAGRALRLDDFDETVETDTLVGVENFEGSAQFDSLDGDERANVLSGNGGIDGLRGGGGNDTLRGGDGDDALDGGRGDHRLDGGAGSDEASYFSEDGGVSDRAVRVDLAAGRAVRGGEVDTLVGVEDAQGSVLGDVLLGSGAANELDGSEGDDRIEGRGGADVLFAGGGADTLSGGDGADVLNGRGGGSDRLTGGGGSDTFDFVFVYNSPFFDGEDVVTDFSQAEGDRIDGGVRATVSRFIRNPFDQFDTNDDGRIDDADGASRAGDVRFDSSVGGGSTVLRVADVEGEGGEVRLTLTGVTGLRETDFLDG